jgi:hypothetical protein
MGPHPPGWKGGTSSACNVGKHRCSHAIACVSHWQCHGRRPTWFQNKQGGPHEVLHLALPSSFRPCLPSFLPPSLPPSLPPFLPSFLFNLALKRVGKGVGSGPSARRGGTTTTRHKKDSIQEISTKSQGSSAKNSLAAEKLPPHGWSINTLQIRKIRVITPFGLDTTWKSHNAWPGPCYKAKPCPPPPPLALSISI